MSSVVVWPLNKHHFLCVPLIHVDPPPRRVRSSDYRTIIGVVGASWMSLREIAAAVQESDSAKIAGNLNRATHAGILERQRMPFEWRIAWGYRRRNSV